MRLTQIQQILEIEKCTSISQAARNLYISQPALSALLNEFETEIGVQLFTRTKAGVKPTENGMTILASMKKIMQEVDFIQTYTAEQSELSGNFKILVGPSYEFLYVELIQQFKKNFPKAHFMQTSPTYHVTDKISKGLLDMAILALYNEDGTMLSKPFAKQYTNLVITPLKDCHTFVIMNRQHRFSNKTCINFSELINEQVILGRQFDISEISGNFSFKKHPLFDIDRLTIFQLLNQNVAIFLDASPFSQEQYQANYPEYCIVPVIDDLSETSNLDLQWSTYFIHRKNQNTRLQQLFIEETKKILQNHNLFI